MSSVRAGISGIMLPTLFPSLDHALPVLWERVRDLPVREAHRDFIRLCIGPTGGAAVANGLTRSGRWSTTLYLGETPRWTAHPLTITTHRP
ncbi:hypothetical protein ACGF07_01405 [Kitasatospora sp. NPDC048194]|uniref:hypothetical protein n=1 Tax=Kitasatospora sp. NPDC048194 TaxID=3364045 RepID=UPI003711C5E8